MPERSNGAVSKTVIRVSGSRVRIPVSPHFLGTWYAIAWAAEGMISRLNSTDNNSVRYHKKFSSLILNLKQTPKSSYTIVRFGSVMINECVSKPVVAKNGTAKLAYVNRGF